MQLPRVLLADDHALLLGAFEKLLAGECEIVGQVSDGRALVAAAERLKPDVIVLDISMPLLNGLEAGRQIKQKLAERQAGVPDDERGSGSGGRSVSRRRVRLPAQAVGGVGADGGDSRSHAGPVVRHAARDASGLVGSLLHAEEPPDA